MTEVAKELNAKWNGNKARAYYVTEYYTQDIWSFDYLKTLGILRACGSRATCSRKSRFARFAIG